VLGCGVDGAYRREDVKNAETEVRSLASKQEVTGIALAGGACDGYKDLLSS